MLLAYEMHCVEKKYILFVVLEGSCPSFRAFWGIAKIIGCIGSFELTSSAVSVCRWEPQRLRRWKQPAPGCPPVPLRGDRVSLSDGTAAPRHQGGRPPAAHQPDENIWQLRLQGGVWGEESHPKAKAVVSITYDCF